MSFDLILLGTQIYIPVSRFEFVIRSVYNLKTARHKSTSLKTVTAETTIL